MMTKDKAELMSLEYRQEVAETILQQLGGNKFRVMTGAKNFMSHNDPGLSFRIPNRASGMPNYVKIRLNSLDYYDVEFGRVRGVDYRITSEHDNVPVENLVELFERQTGLYTRL